MGHLGDADSKGEGLAQSPREAGSNGVKSQDRPLNRPGTEADERAGTPGLDESTTEGLSKSS